MNSSTSIIIYYIIVIITNAGYNILFPSPNLLDLQQLRSRLRLPWNSQKAPLTSALTYLIGVLTPVEVMEFFELEVGKV